MAQDMPVVCPIVDRTIVVQTEDARFVQASAYHHHQSAGVHQVVVAE